ncbi:hypothetical protein [Klebsiella pneumoniae]|uniref:hypothetical protein n=1 Tax=Klebsiella pneumoniae TaxID=573 RepID=UPI0024A9038E|nr:hypothetical protein [Klebsiella pneumoniae]
MFFKRHLTEKEIYKAALPIVRLQGRVNTSLRFLSKYSDVNKNGLIALHLNLLHFISYNIHGVESLKITQAGINKAVQQSPHADEIKNIAQAIGRKGPEYIEGLIREGANKQVISSQADSLIKISRIWADFFPANTSNQPI